MDLLDEIELDFADINFADLLIFICQKRNKFSPSNPIKDQFKVSSDKVVIICWLDYVAGNPLTNSMSERCDLPNLLKGFGCFKKILYPLFTLLLISRLSY